MPHPRAHPARRFRRFATGVAPLSLVISAGIATTPPAAPGAVAQDDPASVPPRLREAVAVLTNSAAAEADRLDAARALIAAATDSARSAVIDMLASSTPDDQPAALLLRALGESSNPAFRPALLAGIQPGSGWPEARRAGAVRALGLDQSRDTVSALIERLAPAEAPAVRTAATSVLIRITGRDDDEARRRGGRDAWAAWFQGRAHLPENLWLADLAAGCAARADRLATARRDVETQYRAAMEQLYNASDAEERHAMLLGMLREPLAAIRQLGLDLVERALDGSQRISPAIAGRVIELLTDQSPDIRGRAALLIDRLRPEGAGHPVAEALLHEKDPEVAGRLLLALRNWPTPVARDVTLHWLAFDDPAVRRRAARAALAAVEAGVLTRPEDKRAIVAALRKAAPQTLSREGMELLAGLGDVGDREIVASLLTTPDVSARRMAALALGSYAELRPRLLEAAARDPQLLPVVVDAIAAGNPPPTLADYDAVAGILPADAAREDHLAAIASALSLADLLDVALRGSRARAEAAAETAGDDPGAARYPAAAFTERILARCFDAAQSINGARPDEVGLLARGLLLLGQLRLSLDRPDTALAALEAIHPAWAPALAPEIAHARTVALLLLGRLDDPRLDGSAPDAWLEALDGCAQRELPHTRDLHEATLRIAETFTDPQRQRFERIAALIPPAPPPPEPDEAIATTPNGGG
jgi:hypothetical protein